MCVQTFFRSSFIRTFNEVNMAQTCAIMFYYEGNELRVFPTSPEKFRRYFNCPTDCARIITRLQAFQNEIAQLSLTAPLRRSPRLRRLVQIIEFSSIDGDSFLDEFISAVRRLFVNYTRNDLSAVHNHLQHTIESAQSQHHL